MEERPSEHELDPTTGAPASGDEVAASSPSDLAERAHHALAGIVALMGYDATVTSEGVQDQTVELSIVGPDAAALVGKNGATLDALQLLVAVMANRGIVDGLRVSIDADGYRERRLQLLEKMARSHADQAKDTGKEIVITDLKAHERRIVHLTLKDDPDVETYSEGFGDERQLVISPRSDRPAGDTE
jgi:spoIIIJ-associated protein